MCRQQIIYPTFNKSLQQSKYPSNWKSAHVIAIFKKGDTSLPSNYRLVSLISCVGKLLERIVYRVKNMLAMYLKYHKAGLTPTTSVTSTAISSVKMAIGHKSLTNRVYF
jgi:hypothetical protein